MQGGGLSETFIPLPSEWRTVNQSTARSAMFVGLYSYQSLHTEQGHWRKLCHIEALHIKDIQSLQPLNVSFSSLFPMLLTIQHKLKAALFIYLYSLASCFPPASQIVMTRVVPWPCPTLPVAVPAVGRVRSRHSLGILASPTQTK